MFKLTTQEQRILAFLLGALVLGTVVKEWRAHRQEAPPTRISETGEKDG